MTRYYDHTHLDSLGYANPAYAAPRIPTPNERIAQMAEFYTRLRGLPVSRREVYRHYGIHVGEAWCVNFIRAVISAAGFQPPSTAHVNSIPEIGNRVRGPEIQAGDIAFNAQHTGIVLKVNRGPDGRAVSYDFLNGNTTEGGRWTVGVQTIQLSANPYQFYRHNGRPSTVTPPPVIARFDNVQGSVFSSSAHGQVRVQRMSPMT